MAKTAGSSLNLSWMALGAMALGAFAVPPGCEGFGGKPDAVGADALPEEVRDALTGLLEDAWPAVIAPTLQRSSIAADGLVDAAIQWRDALDADGDADTAHTAAQAQWQALMSAWQEAELMQVGPAGSSLTAAGGLDLRDEVYSWTTTNPCRVDQETAEEDWAASDFFTVNLVNVYGIDALETLLFSSPEDNACPPQVPPNSDGRWADLGDEGVSALRADFAIALAEHVADAIDEIHTEWDPDGADFAGKLADAGGSGSPFESQQAGLNSIYDALFYLETWTKDRKLGWPMGKRDCGMDDCVSQVESPVAGASHLWIQANLRGFRAVFTGGDQLGMDDLLDSMGHESLTDSMLAALDEADAAAAELNMPIEQAVADDPLALDRVFDAIKSLTALLKGDIATVLSLQIPQEAAGDND
jgi:predicted lipoprotein